MSDQPSAVTETLPSTGTRVNMFVAVLLAAASSVVFYMAGPNLLLRETPLYRLFCGHGWVPYSSVFLFFCALWILVLKVPAIHRERSAFSLQLLAEEAEAAIGVEESRKILGRISRLGARQQSMLLVNRIRQTLLRCAQLGTSEKVDDVLRYRSDVDAAAMESSYAAPKFIIWAIPVLGFVGTVIGISAGVQNFSTLIQNASDLEGLRESLKGVTYGLGQAFECTMVALCQSLILMLIMSALQRREDQLLGDVDDYCMEHLLFKIRMTSATEAAATRELQRMTDLLGQLVEHLRTSDRLATKAPRTISAEVSDAR